MSFVSTDRASTETSVNTLSPYIYVPLILTATLLQKFALPATANAISVGTLIMPVIVGVAWVKKLIFIDPISFFLLGLFIAIGCFSSLTHPEHGFSISSLALVLCAQLPLITRPPGSSRGFDAALQFYCSVMLILCALGVIQYFSQGFVTQSVSFPLDSYVPASFRLSTYNNLNPLEYGADKLKSNGVFFAEPSFFSQAAALAIIIELSSRKRALRLLVLLAGLFVSYSGTGMMLLAPFGLYFIGKGKSFLPLFACVVVGMIILMFGSALRLDTITDRFNEFMIPGSSGYARFVSIFDVMRDHQLSELQTTLFGQGSGQVSSFIAMLPYEGFGPTWGKVFFEYGLVGSLLYCLFLSRLLYGARSAVRYPLLLTYLLLGGYLGDAAVLIPMLLFISWAPRTASEYATTMRDPALDPRGMPVCSAPHMTF